MTEKRHYGRIPFGIEIRVETSAGATTGTLENISLKGVLARFQPCPALEPEEGVRLTLELSPEVRLVFDAAAVHFHDRTIGFRFDRVGADSMAHLVRLLELNTGDAEQVERELHFLVGRL